MNQRPALELGLVDLSEQILEGIGRSDKVFTYQRHRRGKDFPDLGIRWNEVSCFFQKTGRLQDPPFRDESADLVLDFRALGRHCREYTTLAAQGNPPYSPSARIGNSSAWARRRPGFGDGAQALR
jgi:hypothetical protein